jgi:hypothetical protein
VFSGNSYRVSSERKDKTAAAVFLVQNVSQLLRFLQDVLDD